VPPEDRASTERPVILGLAEVKARWDAAGADFARVAGPDLDAYCGQVAIVRETAERVSAEGTVIADAKGNPVAHPAVEIGRKAQAEVRAWAGRFDPPRPRSRR